jgi:hypothetical protein
MRFRTAGLLGLIAGICVMGSLLVPERVAGQASTQTAKWRTLWGEPDVEGIWSPGYYLTPLERPNKYAGREFLTDEEVATLEKGAAKAPGRNARLQKGSVEDVEGAYNDVFTGRGTKVVRTKRTSLIVDPPDGKLPPLTAEGQKRAASSRRARQLATPAELASAFVDRDPNATPYPVDRTMGGGTDNPEDRPADRCSGVTMPFMGSSGTFSRIVQTPGVVSFYFEDGHRGGVYRQVFLDGRPHLPPQMRFWLGHPVGRWEGDTLVVDTTNFTQQTDFHGSRDHLHLTERYTRVAPDLILYRATIDDPTTFTKPWTFELPLTKAAEKNNQIFEAACHEGNYALTTVLAGARVQERQQAADRKKAAGQGQGAK